MEMLRDVFTPEKKLFPIMDRFIDMKAEFASAIEPPIDAARAAAPASGGDGGAVREAQAGAGGDANPEAAPAGAGGDEAELAAALTERGAAYDRAADNVRKET